MGASDLQAAGSPKPQIKQDWELQVFCGGSGAGSLPDPTGKTYYDFIVDNDKFSVKNTLLLVNNVSFAIFSDSFGNTKVPLTLYVMADPAAATPSIGGVALPAATGYDIVLDADDLPQPVDSDYIGKTVLRFYWGNPAYYWYPPGGGVSGPIRTEFIIKRQDFEVNE